jgi:hypothetical protein
MENCAEFKNNIALKIRWWKPPHFRMPLYDKNMDNGEAIRPPN